jgi:carbamoyltransferase
MIKAKIHQVEHHPQSCWRLLFIRLLKNRQFFPLMVQVILHFVTAISKGNQMEVLSSADFPPGGRFVLYCFYPLLGFPHYGDEYKVMGLAPYDHSVEN